MIVTDIDKRLRDGVMESDAFDQLPVIEIKRDWLAKDPVRSVESALIAMVLVAGFMSVAYAML